MRRGLIVERRREMEGGELNVAGRGFVTGYMR